MLVTCIKSLRIYSKICKCGPRTTPSLHRWLVADKRSTSGACSRPSVMCKRAQIFRNKNPRRFTKSAADWLWKRLELPSDVANYSHRIPIGFSAVRFKLIKWRMVKRLTYSIVCYLIFLLFFASDNIWIAVQGLGRTAGKSTRPSYFSRNWWFSSV